LGETIMVGWRTFPRRIAPFALAEDGQKQDWAVVAHPEIMSYFSERATKSSGLAMN
jgi:hypothetical protein